MTSKIHAVTDGLGRCTNFLLTEGQVHESTQIKALLQGKEIENIIGDKAYDSNEIRAFIAAMGSNAVIPCNASRKTDIEYDHHIYKERHLVEIFFQFIKRFRRIGTRYEMKAQNYFGMITLACILQWLIF
jgi:transposase